MKKIHFILGSTFSLLGVCAGTLSAQNTAVTQVTMPADTVYVTAPAPATVVTTPKPGVEYGKMLGIEDYDKLPDDALLPITLDQAEKVIASMIVAARAPGQEAINKAQILNDFKVEQLRKRLLEEALRRTYADEYERRLDRMENFLMLLLANQGLDPNAINHFLSGLNGTPGTAAGLVPGQNALLVPGASDGQTPVALAPGAKAASWEHFLSQVFYAYDSPKLDDDAKKVLNDVAGWVKETGMGITLRGWASPEGNMSYNNKLSGRRVNAAADYLKSLGVDASLLKVIPSGIDSMKDTKNKYPAGRRVDIRPDYGEKI